MDQDELYRYLRVMTAIRQSLHKGGKLVGDLVELEVVETRGGGVTLFRGAQSRLDFSTT